MDIKTMWFCFLTTLTQTAPGAQSELPVSYLSYFLRLLLSELDVVVVFEGDEPLSSVCQACCLLFPYKALGAELDRGMEPK